MKYYTAILVGLAALLATGVAIAYFIDGVKIVLKRKEKP